MFGHGIAGLATENVVKAGLRTALIAQPQKILQRVGYPPAGEEVDRDVELVLGRHIRRAAVPFEHPFIDRVDVLDERHLHLESSCRHRVADRLTELSDDHLLHFAHDVNGAHRNICADSKYHEERNLNVSAHGRAPVCESRLSRGNTLRASASMMILERISGRTLCRVSR